MKLSEMQVDQAFNKIADLVPYATNILKNEEIKSLMKKVEIGGKNEEEKLNNSYMNTISKITPLVNLIFKECKNDLYNIVSILTDMTIKEVKEMNVLDFVKTVMEIVKDEDLIKVFI